MANLRSHRFTKIAVFLYALLLTLLLVLLCVEEWRMRERYANSAQEFEKHYNHVVVFVPEKDVSAGARLDSVNLTPISWRRSKLENDVLVSRTELHRYGQHRTLELLPARKVIRRSQLTDQLEND